MRDICTSIILLLIVTRTCYLQSGSGGSECQYDDRILDYPDIIVNVDKGIIMLAFQDFIHVKLHLKVFSDCNITKPDYRIDYINPRIQIPFKYLRNEFSCILVTTEDYFGHCSSLRYNLHHLTTSDAIATIHLRPGEDSCITISTDELQLMWPLNAEFKEHCICSIEELKLELCQCLKDTKYTITVKNKSVCFSGTNVNMNNMVVYLQKTEACQHKDCKVIKILKGFIFTITQQFTFIYNNFTFDEHVYIAWNNAIECGEGIVYYYFVNSADNQQMMLTNETFIKINRRELSDHIRYYVEAAVGNSTCTTSATSLEISSDVYTNVIEVLPNNNSCLPVYNLLSTVILPLDNDGQDGSCICDDIEYIDFCSCIDSITSYHIYYSNRQLCIGNVVNNTKLQFVYQASNSFENDFTSNYPRYNELFVESYHLWVIGLPSPPNLKILNQSLCFEDSYKHQRIQYYTVTVTDITRFYISSVVIRNETTCLTLPYFIYKNTSQVSITTCGSLNITITSHNVLGVSAPGFHQLDLNGQEDLCTCFNENVEILMNLTLHTDENRVIVNLTCDTNYSDFENAKFKLEISQLNKILYWVYINCSETAIILSSDIKGTNIATLKWLLNDENDCTVDIQPVDILAETSYYQYYSYIILSCFMVLLIATMICTIVICQKTMKIKEVQRNMDESSSL